jgi:hypothetical protein
MRMFRAGRQALAIAAAVAMTLLLAACGGPAGVPGASPGRTGVISLNKISTLKSLFNRDYGHTRLILIFSPT